MLIQQLSLELVNGEWCNPLLQKLTNSQQTHKLQHHQAQKSFLDRLPIIWLIQKEIFQQVLEAWTGHR